MINASVKKNIADFLVTGRLVLMVLDVILAASNLHLC